MVKVNVGAGRESFPDWLSLDLQPGTSLGGRLVDVSPDLIGSAGSLPFDDDSIEALRTRDLLMDYHAMYGGSISALCREFHRVLRPGGKWIAIEVDGFATACKRYFDVKSVHKGGKIAYLADIDDDELDGSSRNYVTVVYVKR